MRPETKTNNIDSTSLNSPPIQTINVLEFAKRTFPHVSDAEKTDFIHNTNAMSGIPLEKSTIADYFIKNKNIEPAITGQINALRLAAHFATIPTTVPNKYCTQYNFDEFFPWFRKINLNILGDYVQNGTLYRYNRCEQDMNEIQSYRRYDIETFYGITPRPIKIRSLLAESFNAYISVYKKYIVHLDNPRMLERSDYEDLEIAIRRLVIDVCTIKPFMDGNNRTSRILENILRLNVGLPFHTFSATDFTQPIKDRYRAYYRKYAPASLADGAPDCKIVV